MPIWLVKWWKPVAVVAAWVAMYVLISWYGHVRYESGRADEKAKIVALTAAIERGMQAEKDRADAEYRGAILARQAADRLVADQRKRIDGLLDQLRRRPETARASSGFDEPGEDWIGTFGQCVAEYERMGAEAGRLADKVNGLQGYVRGRRLSTVGSPESIAVLTVANHGA
jgi:hypothetical protein